MVVAMSTEPTAQPARSLSDGWGGPYATAPYATTIPTCPSCSQRDGWHDPYCGQPGPTIPAPKPLPFYLPALSRSGFEDGPCYLLTDATLRNADPTIVDVSYIPTQTIGGVTFGARLQVITSPDDPGPYHWYCLPADAVYVTPAGNLAVSGPAGNAEPIETESPLA